MSDKNNNTGDWNTGNWNTGNWNTGNRNTGDWNNCDKETGFFNTQQSEKIRVFNKECPADEWNNCEKPNFIYFSLTEWVSSSDMTDKEKDENQTHMTTGGYLKVYDYKEAFKKSWGEADEEDRKKIFNLPNFDAEVFKEISGIDLNKDSKRSKELKELKQTVKDAESSIKEALKRIKELES